MTADHAAASRGVVAGIGARLDAFLAALAQRGRASPRLGARELLGASVVASAAYGAFMGSFAFAWPDRLLMVLYATIKMPLLLGVTTLLCLPGFAVISSVAGLRRDLAAALRAILAGQAALACALASLGPVTRVVYSSGVTHQWALLTNVGMFAIATGVGHMIMLRAYRPLIEKDPRHRGLLVLWVVLYAFVGIQMGWTLRPFVGTPGIPVTFFRAEPFSNAYVEVADLVRSAVFGGGRR